MPQATTIGQQHHRSHVTLTVTRARLLVLRSSPRFLRKREAACNLIMDVKLEIFRCRTVLTYFVEIMRHIVDAPKNNNDDDVFFFSVVKTRNKAEDTSETEWYETLRLN